jgi:lysine-arginine-ornithine-binding protein
LCVGFIFFAGITCFAGEKIKIATEGSYPPFNYLDPNGELKGFEVDLAKALCKAMDRECEIVVQDWDGMIPGLIAKKYDAIIASMSITEERKKAVNFSKPYYDEFGMFVVKKSSNIEISPEGLKGKTVGVQRATIWANYLKAVYGNSVKINYYDAVENHNLDLKAGRVDAVLVSYFSVNEWLKTPDGSECEMAGEPIRDKEYVGEGVGVALRKADTDLLEDFNKAIDQVTIPVHKKNSFAIF